MWRNISNTETFVNIIVGVHNTMQIEFYVTNDMYGTVQCQNW